MDSTRVIRLAMTGAALLTLLMATPSKANLIVNGSFETPLTPLGQYTDYGVGDQGLIVWTVVGNDVDVLCKNFQQNGITFQAEDGNQTIDLTRIKINSPFNGIEQSVATVIGQRYVLTFYVGSATDNNIFFASTVNLSIDGGALTSYYNPTAPTNMLN